jgi:predicted NUDIX family phosphoesterase
MNQLDKNQQIKDLEQLAKEVLNLKHELGLRRPLIIEFCGTPKAGKTTTINSLNIFLKRNEFRTVVISEMAGICPIRNKTNYFFNTWTLLTSMAETLKHITVGESKTDLILIDRSIFDALCWFHWLSKVPIKNPYLDKEGYKLFVDFLVGSKIWTRHIDLIYIFKTNPKQALQREFAELLTNKPGSIMNNNVLTEFNDSIDSIKNEYGNKFRKIEEYDTSNHDPNIVGSDITNTVLNVLKDLLTEKIGYFLGTFKQYIKYGVNKFSEIESKVLFFGQRDIIEKEDYLQPVAIAVITDSMRKNVLVLKKNESKTSKDSPEHNRFLLYLGGHTRIEDKSLEPDTNITVFKNALHREIKEELNESISIPEEMPFIIYTPVSEKSKRHLAVCFVIEMDLEHKNFNPTKEEFIHKSTTSKSGTVMKVNDLFNLQGDLETWSQVILSHVFGINKTLFDE